MNKNKALFILNSPFQALCASEAILHYGISEAHFLLFESKIVVDKTLPLVKDFGECHLIHAENGGTSATIEALRNQRIHERYSTIFVGDYYSYIQYVSAIYMAKPGANIIYLDDGNSTLLIGPPVSLKRGRSRREKIYYCFWDFQLKLKRINKSLFTIFEFRDGCPLKTERNSFASLTIQEKEKRGVYVIGTNSDAMSFKDVSYADELKILSTYIISLYPNEDVFYCPHRGDSHDYTEVIKDLGWKLFDTKYSVEIDFVKKGIYPLTILGFGSTALLTLRRLYQDSVISTIYVNLAEEKDNKEYRAIEQYYQENGIELVRL